MDAIDYLGRGVIHVVAHTPGLDDIARYIVAQKKVDLDLLDSKARSALYLAVESENFTVAKILADAGAHITSDNARMAKLLCTIGAENELDKLKFLVQCGTNLEQADYDKRTIAHLASAEGNIDILKFLIEHTDFDFSMKDRWETDSLAELKDHNLRRELK